MGPSTNRLISASSPARAMSSRSATDVSFATEQLSAAITCYRHCEWSPECELPTPVTVPEGLFYVLGDNRGQSHDSRQWGPISCRLDRGTDRPANQLTPEHPASAPESAARSVNPEQEYDRLRVPGLSPGRRTSVSCMAAGGRCMRTTSPCVPTAAACRSMFSSTTTVATGLRAAESRTLTLRPTMRRCSSCFAGADPSHRSATWARQPRTRAWSNWRSQTEARCMPSSSTVRCRSAYGSRSPTGTAVATAARAISEQGELVGKRRIDRGVADHRQHLVVPGR